MVFIGGRAPIWSVSLRALLRKQLSDGFEENRPAAPRRFFYANEETGMADKIVTANRLDDGLVVYLNGASGGGSWSERIEYARIAGDDAAADGLLAEAEGQGQEIRVIEPYLIEVALEGAEPRPVSYREAIRAQGPTVRLDLGKQADFA